VYILEEKIATF